MRKLLKWMLWIGFLLVTASLAMVVFYRFVPVPVTATMLMDEHGITKDWEPLEKIDRDMVRAVIAAEDSKFCAHDGFDWEAIEKAREQNARSGRIRGGSTISQQTAKNVFLWQGGGYFRKGVEAYFTFLIEKIWGKRRIMEVYLNVAETGIGTYGVKAGAERYFGHGADNLSVRQAAAIAAVLPLPKERPGRNPSGFTARYGSTIATRMGVVARDGLDACVYPSGASEPVQTLEKRPEPPKPRGAPAREGAPAAEEPAAPSEDLQLPPAPLPVPPQDSPAVPDAEPPPPPPADQPAAE
ncbi:monofunctional biosynthetic peptidoglycan transglycosylase [Sphingomicrobium lutaoense]|uniref:Biosynthetic peptidoglycan transglycosylase n=1 Tax=Sphingomicrobium lutaoense TaxID=515949 RepID=A0A839Z1Y6_9SPHN|nr:monofunctional biosynthetic peptidoglycan transglycosylase [Sphingomicrobium lutaoense]